MAFIRKVGTIKLTLESYFAHGIDNKFYHLYKYFTPLEINIDYKFGDVTLTGFSEDFEELREGESAPQYSVIVEEVEGMVFVSFDRL